MGNIKLQPTSNICNFFPWMIIIWVADKKTLQTATICQQPICLCPFMGSCIPLPISIQGLGLRKPIGTLKTNQPPHLQEHLQQSHDLFHTAFFHPDKPEANCKEMVWHVAVAMFTRLATTSTSASHGREGQTEETKAKCQFQVSASVLGSTGNSGL